MVLLDILTVATLILTSSLSVSLSLSRLLNFILEDMLS